METVYRVQDRRGYGLYSSPTIPFERIWANLGDDSVEHPSPLCLGERNTELHKAFLRSKIKYKFGFSSWNQYEEWIPSVSVREKLRDLNARAVKIEAEDVRRGNYQVVFNEKKYWKVVAILDPVSSQELPFEDECS